MPKAEVEARRVERNHVYGDKAVEAVAVARGERLAGSREADPHKLAQRLKQIEFGYNTTGYERYRKEVAKPTRAREQPRTPDRFKVMSKRAWEGLIRKWRRELHEWDPIELQGERRAAGADGARARADLDAASSPADHDRTDAASATPTCRASTPNSEDDDDGLVAGGAPSDDEDGPADMLISPPKPKQSAAAAAARRAADSIEAEASLLPAAASAGVDGASVAPAACADDVFGEFHTDV
jgi:hypothetical protein